MTCIHIAVSVPAPGCAPWLVGGTPCGPRSPRTHWPFADRCGPVLSTSANWMPDGSQAIALQDLLAGREALIEELSERRKKHRATSSTLADLRMVTEALMQMGVR
jgi:hypothetical protein